MRYVMPLFRFGYLSDTVFEFPSDSRFSIQHFMMPEDVEKADEQEFVAKTYLELLRKLTAAEIFAAEQQALSMPGTSRELLPLLQSLREDIEKIHKVA